MVIGTPLLEQSAQGLPMEQYLIRHELNRKLAAAEFKQIVQFYLLMLAASEQYEELQHLLMTYCTKEQLRALGVGLEVEPELEQLALVVARALGGNEAFRLLKPLAKIISERDYQDGD